MKQILFSVFAIFIIALVSCNKDKHFYFEPVFSIVYGNVSGDIGGDYDGIYGDVSGNVESHGLIKIHSSNACEAIKNGFFSADLEKYENFHSENPDSTKQNLEQTFYNELLNWYSAPFSRSVHYCPNCMTDNDIERFRTKMKQQIKKQKS
ncbi:MAG: hypothetical protein MJZ63_04440 [Muribaculaceae bacterium]|nr:hypothetical protein [Muribaculaceae bacterium]